MSKETTADRRYIASIFCDGDEPGADSNNVRAYAVAFVWAQAPAMFNDVVLNLLIDSWCPGWRGDYA